MILLSQSLLSSIVLASLCLVTVACSSIHPSEAAKHAVVRVSEPPQSLRLQPQIQVAAPAISVVRHSIDADFLTTGRPVRACPDDNNSRQTLQWWRPLRVLQWTLVIKTCLIIQTVKIPTSISFKFLRATLTTSSRRSQTLKQILRAKIWTNTKLAKNSAKTIVMLNLIIQRDPMESK